MSATVNNRLGGLTYDAAGNVTGDSPYNYTWTAENELSWASGPGYAYDGLGRRVWKGSANEPKLYWYGSGGEILSETGPTGYLINDYIYFGGKRIAAVPNDFNLNGGFEQGLQNWTASGSGTAQVINNPANAHSGNDYAEVSTPAGFTTTTLTTSQPIAGYKGETITASGWAYHETGVSGKTRWWLKVLGSNGNVAGHPSDNATMNAWIFQSVALTIPTWLQGPYTVTMWASVEGGSDSTSGRFDDATLNGNTVYFVGDMLGTSRVMTTDSGVVCYDADFYPYGGERPPYTNTCSSVYKFEGKERETETGIDNFGARIYNSRFGRWYNADWSAVPVAVPYANLTNPQTLNLYAMVSDDPESFADLDGHCWSGFQWICNTGQRFVNASTGLGFHTNQQVEDIVHRDNLYLHDRGFNTEGLRDREVMKAYKLTLAAGAARPTAAQARAIWEKATGKRVPFDEESGRFYDMHHKTAIGDGGDPRDPNNLTPLQHDEHVEEHRANGDFKRWGARSKQAENLTPDQVRQLEMEMETESEMENNANRVPSTIPPANGPD